MATYQPGIPTGSVPLNQDYLNIQGNFTQANVVYGTDHYAFDNITAGQEGFHKQVTMPNAAAPPTTAAAQGIVFTQNSAESTGRTDLYYAYQTSGGTPLTGALFPLTATKAFGVATGRVVGLSNRLVSGSSFNVSTVTFATASPDTWTINLTSPIVNADFTRILVVVTPIVSGFNAAVNVMCPTPSANNQVLVYSNSSSCIGINFVILAV